MKKDPAHFPELRQLPGYARSLILPGTVPSEILIHRLVPGQPTWTRNTSRDTTCPASPRTLGTPAQPPRLSHILHGQAKAGTSQAGGKTGRKAPHRPGRDNCPQREEAGTPGDDSPLTGLGEDSVIT